MKKSDVNGENELPLYTYLKSQKGFEGLGKGAKALAMSAILKKMDRDYKNNPNIKWNFTKFIIDREGNVAARFEPTADIYLSAYIMKKQLIYNINNLIDAGRNKDVWK